MTPQVKSILILLGTFIIGGLLGGTVVGMISGNRVEQRKDIRGPGGFVRHMERIIDIKDSAQHAAVHPILEKTNRKHRAIFKAAADDVKQTFDTMLVELEPYLEPDQLERLEKEHQMMQKKGQPPGPLGGPPPRKKGPLPGEEE